MANTYRKRKVTDRANERRFCFVAQIPAPEGGFASILDAIKAWHCYSASMQRPWIGQRPNRQPVKRWSFESMQIAEGFRLRFGGETGSASEETMPAASAQRDTARQCCDDIRGRRAPAAVRRKRG
jgi:hypothetical protein